MALLDRVRFSSIESAEAALANDFGCWFPCVVNCSRRELLDAASQVGYRIERVSAQGSLGDAPEHPST